MTEKHNNIKIIRCNFGTLKTPRAFHRLEKTLQTLATSPPPPPSPMDEINSHVWPWDVKSNKVIVIVA